MNAGSTFSVMSRRIAAKATVGEKLEYDESSPGILAFTTSYFRANTILQRRIFTPFRFDTDLLVHELLDFHRTRSFYCLSLRMFEHLLLVSRLVIEDQRHVSFLAGSEDTRFLLTSCLAGNSVLNFLH